MAYIPVHVTDHEGIVKALEEKAVHVEVEDVGTLQAVGSADPRATESYTEHPLQPTTAG